MILLKLRAPAVPLVTVDPYLSIWSMKDSLTDDITRHWTGKDHRLTGTAEIDGKTYRFMGQTGDEAMEQVSVDWNALSTFYTFRAAGVELCVTFTSPMLCEDVELMSRPVSYIKAEAKSADGKTSRRTTSCARTSSTSSPPRTSRCPSPAWPAPRWAASSSIP